MSQYAGSVAGRRLDHVHPDQRADRRRYDGRRTAEHRGRRRRPGRDRGPDRRDRQGPVAAAAGRGRVGAQASGQAEVREARADPGHHHAGQGPGRGPADVRGPRHLGGAQVSAAEARTTAGRIADWFTPKIALARVAWLRTVLYLFVILDMHAFVRDTRLKGEHPGLYQPLLLARHVRPAQAVGGQHDHLVRRPDRGLSGRRDQQFPRLAGWIVAPGVHLVGADRDERRQGRPRPPRAGGRALGASRP